MSFFHSWYESFLQISLTFLSAWFALNCPSIFPPAWKLSCFMQTAMGSFTPKLILLALQFLGSGKPCMIQQAGVQWWSLVSRLSQSRANEHMKPQECAIEALQPTSSPSITSLLTTTSFGYLNSQKDCQFNHNYLRTAKSHFMSCFWEFSYLGLILNNFYWYFVACAWFTVL